MQKIHLVKNPFVLINLLFCGLVVLFTSFVHAEEQNKTGALPIEQSSTEQSSKTVFLSEQETEALLEKLKSGGYIIYLRHANTNQQEQDQAQVILDDCLTQRNLNEEGKALAKTIGAVFKQKNIPISQVLSSPYCRCKETGEIAFGNTAISNDLYFASALAKEERDKKSEVLRLIITTPPSPHTNTILISHTTNLKETVNIWPKPEGAMHIFLPEGKNQFKHMGAIDPSIWSKILLPANL